MAKRSETTITWYMQKYFHLQASEICAFNIYAIFVFVFLRIVVPHSAAMFLRSLQLKSRERLASVATYTSATNSGRAHDVTCTDCQTQNDIADDRDVVTVKR